MSLNLILTLYHYSFFFLSLGSPNPPRQVVKYLSNPSLVPTVRQSSHSIAKLIKQLTDPAKAYGLTKAEVLGCVNLGPTKLVELFMVSVSAQECLPSCLVGANMVVVYDCERSMEGIYDVV